MNIFDHIIPDKYILGIGPLMLEFTQSQELEILYGRRRYFFDLHLVAHTTTIKSEWFDVKESSSEQQRMKSFKEHYHLLREQVAKLIGEETDQFKVKMQNAHKLHVDAVENFQTLLTELVPVTNDKTDEVNLRTQRVYDDLLNLKMLASN